MTHVTDFNRAPFIVIWEVTRACALACLHCRADAIPHRNPFELPTADAEALIDEIRAFGDPPPLFVLTGGDPMRRPDLAQLVSRAARKGLTVAVTPSGTAAATKARLAELRDAGVSRANGQRSALCVRAGVRAERAECDVQPAVRCATCAAAGINYTSLTIRSGPRC